MAHPTEWCVAVGRPSYHQARAGGSSAGEMCWTTKLKALRYMANVKRRNKHETMTLIPPRGLSGARRRRKLSANERLRKRMKKAGWFRTRRTRRKR